MICYKLALNAYVSSLFYNKRTGISLVLLNTTTRLAVTSMVR